MRFDEIAMRIDAIRSMSESIRVVFRLWKQLVDEGRFGRPNKMVRWLVWLIVSVSACDHSAFDLDEISR